MDHYTNLVELLKRHQAQIIEQVIAEIQPLNYFDTSENTVEKYRELAVYILNVITEAVRIGDAASLRDLAVMLTKKLEHRNHAPLDFEKHNQIFNQKLKELVEREFADQPKVKTSYLRRLDSISMLGNVSSITTTISNKSP